MLVCGLAIVAVLLKGELLVGIAIVGGVVVVGLIGIKVAREIRWQSAQRAHAAAKLAHEEALRAHEEARHARDEELKLMKPMLEKLESEALERRKYEDPEGYMRAAPNEHERRKRQGEVDREMHKRLVAEANLKRRQRDGEAELERSKQEKNNQLRAAIAQAKELAGHQRHSKLSNKSSHEKENIDSSGHHSVQADVVYCSVFSPSLENINRTVLVQVFLHLHEQASRVVGLAQVSDVRAKAQPSQMLDVEIRRGTMVDILLDGKGLLVDEARLSLKWRGEPTVAQFSVRFPRVERGVSNVFHPVVRIFVGGVPVGRIMFILEAEEHSPLDAHSAMRRETRLQGKNARHYSRAFLSYSSQDRREVLRSAQALQAANIEVFQDVLSLDPGDSFREKIISKIEQADVFLLFWSRHAAKSQWVTKEWRYALARKHRNADDLPDIIPIPLTSPDVVPPPKELADLHFNSPLVSMIAASQPRPRSLLSRLFGGRD